jgi:hypothetical protein
MDHFVVWTLASGARILLVQDNTMYDFWYGFHRVVAAL